jgi:DNA-dependent protein kinase catalytic subunit
LRCICRREQEPDDLEFFEAVLMGDKDHDIRARLKPTDLTAEEQVAALLNQATDPNILGRTYCGFEPWV